MIELVNETNGVKSLIRATTEQICLNVCSLFEAINCRAAAPSGG